ncbi:hypothetical protein HaLaN_24315 [Haematococcus lacustris]|uniref:Uncharacterized protein n=1 Tax=Haematococcus lacustris TaxID=44745 RepID=A0A699ZTL0_HAELA|nr:hypothetical protein HaLaN_24315 [Haematococcus lacustris]
MATLKLACMLSGGRTPVVRARRSDLKWFTIELCRPIYMHVVIERVASTQVIDGQDCAAKPGTRAREISGFG